MSQFFMAILIIVFGGFLALILARQAHLMKIVAVFSLSAGCLLGLIDTGAKLAASGIYTASFEFLKVFSLVFQIDGLAAFFLAAIFMVSLLATIYSFHYMDHSKKTLRVAANYFFFSLLIAAMALVVTAANIITFMLSWEIMSLSSFFLVVYNYESEENRRAG
ncbi:MAG: hydrogenase, partial [Desulfobacteraceae bacterium]|nr:hydrogenase [Desulfobacteraceae bacterium]